MARVTKDDIDKFFDYDIDLTNRTLYVGSVSVTDDGDESGVDAIMAERVIKALHLLEAQGPQGDKPITIIMNNPGGDWYHGMAIYDAIKSCKNHITIKVFGMAMSMGSIILQAADERILAPNAKVMIHYGYMGMPANHTKIFQKWAEETKRINHQMVDIYMEKILSKNPNFQRKKLIKMCNFDTILTAQEAVNLGLADSILI
jgi:ATP-dependent Clp endopeptidase proteolytic subunit ClpP